MKTPVTDMWLKVFKNQLALLAARYGLDTRDDRQFNEALLLLQMTAQHN